MTHKLLLILDIRNRIEEFERNESYFRVEGIYPLKVVMRLQNEMMENLMDKQADHLIETILVRNESILRQLPEHLTDFMEILIVPDYIKPKKKRVFSVW